MLIENFNSMAFIQVRYCGITIRENSDVGSINLHTSSVIGQMLTCDSTNSFRKWQSPISKLFHLLKPNPF